MSEIINLNQVRKARKKSEAQKIAAENRRSFGRTKAEKDQAKRIKDKLDQHQDGHKLSKSHAPSEEDPDPK